MRVNVCLMMQFQHNGGTIQLFLVKTCLVGLVNIDSSVVTLERNSLLASIGRLGNNLGTLGRVGRLGRLGNTLATLGSLGGLLHVLGRLSSLGRRDTLCIVIGLIKKTSTNKTTLVSQLTLETSRRRRLLHSVVHSFPFFPSP